MLRSISAFVYVGLLPTAVFGAPFQPIDGISGSYVPGQAVSFDVRLPDITNLGSYNIDVVLEGNSGTAGVDYFFDAAATMPAATNYVFPSATNYFDTVTVDSATRHRLTLTDFDFTGANIVSGVNDRVATVVIGTAPTFGGSLSVFVDASLLLLDTPDIVPTPVQGFSEIQDSIAAAPSIELTPVPEPTTALLLLLLGFAAVSSRRLALALHQAVATTSTTIWNGYESTLPGYACSSKS